MIRLLSALSLTAAFVVQAAPPGDAWSRVAALYHRRPGDRDRRQQPLTSKRNPRRTTRAVDDELRDAIAREFWTRGVP